ncbi:hypothetical protein [Dietzia sp. ANT_WB102]|uniref:hypothetical protein n=1 Tax=Dietzia sp. ANT_WB102 TaxID=2597345 RepID=UPI0011EEC649|nr:hypothetical protein [Dietzia sp. ANT_WB102]KAA0916958.1 hypothetical protein FQ137_11970 [Dietzia sp. ANT_WB102]
MSTNTHPADGPENPTAGFSPDHPTQTEPPLYEPLPYGAGFSDPNSPGFGVFSEPAPTHATAVEVVERRRSGSPVLAVAGVASLAVAVWAILGAPVITPTVLLAAGLIGTVLVGLMMVVRR